MSNNWKLVLLSVTLMCQWRSIYPLAIPLTAATPTASTYTTYGDDVIDNEDDSVVVEVTGNALDEAVVRSMKDIIDLSFYGKSLYGRPDGERTAKLVANYTPETSPVNPEELGSYLEGDILIPSNEHITKNGVTTQSSRWRNGLVPFEIRGQFAQRDLATIQQAMEEYHTRTCIRFIPRTVEQDYISIVSGNSGCWSSVGRVGGKQEVNLQSPGCLSKPGTAMHELMHALGFLHEQNRQERDGFVAIQYQNIQPSAVTNFEKAARTNAYGVPYDYGSVMHYSANAFSSNGQPTIVPVQSGGNARMGQRDGFSVFDVEKLNKMYDCGYGGAGGAGAMPMPAPMPGVMPGQMPGVMPGQMPGGGYGPVGGGGVPNNNLINSFLGGLINGLGFGDDASKPTDTDINTNTLPN